MPRRGNPVVKVIVERKNGIEKIIYIFADGTRLTRQTTYRR